MIHGADSRRRWQFEKPMVLVFWHAAQRTWDALARSWQWYKGKVGDEAKDLIVVLMVWAIVAGLSVVVIFVPLDGGAGLFVVLILCLAIGCWILPVSESSDAALNRFHNVFLLTVVPLLLATLAGVGIWICLAAVGLVLTPVMWSVGLVCDIYPFYRKLRGVTLHCKRGFHRFKDLRLGYLCPGCGTPYGGLVPSHFGLLFHNCTCGARLPTSALLGREKLRKCCPECGHPWGHGTTPLPERFIALVGGVSTGKTCYLTMVVESLIRNSLGESPLEGSIEDEADRTAHKAMLAPLSRGDQMKPTVTGVPDAFVLKVRSAASSFRLYIYDASGEEYRLISRTGKDEFVFFEDLDGVVLLVDPLNLPGLGDKVAEFAGVSRDGLQISPTPLEDIIAGLLANVRRFVRYGRSGRTSVPVAVVINKSDVSLVGNRVWDQVIDESRSGSRHDEEDGHEREHIACRAALKEWGAGSAITLLEHNFQQVRYFSCSALGRTPDGTGRPFTPERVLPPLLWLLSTDGKIAVRTRA